METRSLNLAMSYPVQWTKYQMMNNFVQNFYDALGAKRFRKAFKWEYKDTGEEPPPEAYEYGERLETFPHGEREAFLRLKKKYPDLYTTKLGKKLIKESEYGPWIPDQPPMKK